MVGNIDSWDGFTGTNWVKADVVKSESDAFVCVNTELEDKDNPQPLLTLQHNEEEYKFTLNVSNSKKCKELKITKPADLIGKKLYFKKILVRDPSTNKEVDGLRIHKIE